MANHPNRNNPGLTQREASRVMTAIGFALSGEMDEGWQDDMGPLCRSAMKKLDAIPRGGVMVSFSKSEIRQLLEAVSQMTDGNARSFDEWRQQTHGTKAQWDALIAAEQRLSASL